MNHAVAIQRATSVDVFAGACRNFAEALDAAANNELRLQGADLVDLAREIGNLARIQQLRGATELMRLWVVALEARALDGQTPEAETLVLMSQWFTSLSACASTDSAPDDFGALVRSLRAFDWIPAVSVRMQNYLVAHFGSRVPSRASATGVVAQAANGRQLAARDSTRCAAAADCNDNLSAQSSDLEPHVESSPCTNGRGADHQPWIASASGVGSRQICGADDPARGHGRTYVSAGSTSMAAAEYPSPSAPTDTASSDAGALIWIGQPELDLLTTTLLEQFLPAVQAWDEAAAVGDATEQIDAVVYLTGLLANACEVLGLSALGQSAIALRRLLGDVIRGEHTYSPADLMPWVAAWMLVVEHPGGESAVAVADATPRETITDPRWPELLSAELTRVRIGIDPAVVAARRVDASADDVDLQIAADVLPSVLDGMLRELPGHASRFGALVRGFASSLESTALEEARRIAHTLKGDANTVGLRGLGNLTHILEDILDELARDPALFDRELISVLSLAADTIEEISEYVTGRGSAPQGLLALYQQVLDVANTLTMRDAPAATRSELEPPGESPRLTGAAPAVARVATAAERMGDVPLGAEVAPIAPLVQPQATLHVPLTQLDELLRLSGETLVLATQIEERLRGVDVANTEMDKQIRGARDLVTQLDDLVAMRGAALQATRQIGQGDIDPLELDQYDELHVVSRRLIETNTDEGELVDRIDAQLRQLKELTVQQERLHTDLQRLVVRTRTVPFEQVGPRLQRIVRQTARQLDKQVVLDIRGGQAEIDSEILDRLIEPLGHALRNAVDHGIEMPQERIAAGKPAEGHIEIEVRAVGDVIEISVRDDGQGLDLAAIRVKALSIGLIDADASVDDDAIARLILRPGFSTREAATQVSGRGIGMDVVNQRMLALRGSLTLHSQSGSGLSLLLRAPSNQLAANVVVARGASCVLAATAASVVRVVSLVQEVVEVKKDGSLCIDIDGIPTPLYRADGFFLRDDEPMPIGSMSVGLLVADSRGRHHVIGAQRIDEVRNAVVKSLGSYVAPISAVRGITILGDGGIAPVLDLVALVESLSSDSRLLSAVVNEQPSSRPCVVVADDSLSVRRALAQLMQDAGFEVVAARDGLEALNAINASNPVAVLLDLEMPRLNGLEVARFMRTRESTRDVPIIMITSRSGERYQTNALQAGVTKMIGKPFDEDELVRILLSEIASRADRQTLS